MSLARKMVITLVFSGVLLAVVVYLAGARATALAARQVGLPAFCAVGAVLFAMMGIQAAAWAGLERNMGHRPRYRTLLAATIVGMAGNILTPSTYLGGEPGKVLYAGRKTHLPYTELAGTVLLCKYVEALSFVLFLGFATAVALVGFRGVLLRPPLAFLGGTILVLGAVALLLGGLLCVALWRKWTPLTRLVALVARLRIRPRFFQALRERALRMELQASRMFREEGGAVVPAFFWYLLTHVAMFARPLVFFLLGWRIRLNLADLGLIFLASQVLLAVQLTPSGVGTLDGGLLGLVALVEMGITVPQCAAFLLCVRFWDAVVVTCGALLAARAGVGLFRQRAAKPQQAAEARPPQE